MSSGTLSLGGIRIL